MIQNIVLIFYNQSSFSSLDNLEREGRNIVTEIWGGGRERDGVEGRERGRKEQRHREMRWRERGSDKGEIESERRKRKRDKRRGER